MIKQLLGTRRTTKTDVVIGIAAAIFAVAKAADTVNQYKTENEDPETKENTK